MLTFQFSQIILQKTVISADPDHLCWYNILFFYETLLLDNSFGIATSGMSYEGVWLYMNDFMIHNNSHFGGAYIVFVLLKQKSPHSLPSIPTSPFSPLKPTQPSLNPTEWGRRGWEKERERREECNKRRLLRLPLTHTDKVIKARSSVLFLSSHWFILS